MECVNEVSFVDKFRARATDWQTVLESQCSLMWNEASIIANEGFPVGYKGLFLVHGTRTWRPRIADFVKMLIFGLSFRDILRLRWLSKLPSS